MFSRASASIFIVLSVSYLIVESLHILDMNSLFGVCIMSLLLACGLPFHSLMVSSDERKVFS